MKNKHIYLFCLIFSGILFSCSEESPIEGEQYIKQLYIIGATDAVKAYDVPYGDGPQETYITIATGGSQNLDKDVVVKLTTNDETIDWYNNKYMIDSYMKYSKLDDNNYDIPSMSVTVKAGEVYARLPFTVNTSNIDCDELYALTFKIESVSDYQKVTKDTVLMMNLNMVNEYSGTYMMTMTRYTIVNDKETDPQSLQNIERSLKATDKNSVRFLYGATSEKTSSYATRDDYFNSIDENGVVFYYDEATQTFKAKGWKNMQIVDSDITYTYNSVLEKGAFEFSYDYDNGGTIYRVKGTLKE